MPYGGSLRRAGAARARVEPRVAPRDGVHEPDRRPRGNLDGRLGGGPLAHDHARRRPCDRPARLHRRRTRPAAARAGRRCAATRRTDRGGGGSRPSRRPPAGGRGLRDHEGRRDDGPRPRPDRLLRAARPQARHRRRPDRVPAADGEARRARELREAADRVRRVHGRRLPRDADREAPRRSRQGGDRPPRGRAGPRALRML